MKKTLIILMLLLLTIGCSKKVETIPQIDIPEIIVEPTLYYSKFDGLLMDKQDSDKGRAFAILIDNAKKARWQAGLSKAAIIHELRVEALATRYLAIFNTEEDIEIGPIRSVRPYHVHLASMYGALLIHHGGMDNVLNIMPSYNVENINGMNYDGSTFVRQNHRYAPHNSYVSINRLNNRADLLNYQKENQFDGFNFYRKKTQLNGDIANNISINYGYDYLSEYVYKENEQIYQRLSNKEIHLDETTKKPLAVSNIIIRFVDYKIAANGVHKDFNNVGNGTGYLVSLGQYIPITWSKESNGANTIYKKANGEVITLNAGQTWIHWIENESNVTISE